MINDQLHTQHILIHYHTRHTHACARAVGQTHMHTYTHTYRHPFSLRWMSTPGTVWSWKAERWGRHMGREMDGCSINTEPHMHLSPSHNKSRPFSITEHLSIVSFYVLSISWPLYVYWGQDFPQQLTSSVSSFLQAFEANENRQVFPKGTVQGKLFTWQMCLFKNLSDSKTQTVQKVQKGHIISR